MRNRTPNPMHIGILARGLSVEIGGARRYIEALIPELIRLGTAHRFSIYHNSAGHRGRYSTERVREVCFDAPGVFWWENVRFPAALRQDPPDVLLCPKNLIPWFLPRSVRAVPVILDLLYFPIPGVDFVEYKPWDIAYMRLFLRDSLRRAARIVTISENTRKDLLAMFRVSPEKVKAVHLGVTSSPLPTRDQRDQVRKKYGLVKSYVFYAGSLSPRKNMARMVQALARIGDRVPHDLVVTAGKTWGDDEFFAAVRKFDWSTRIRQLGAVPDDDLPALYSAADMFVYPSLYEGFGLPVLEAMACGCPVLTSNTSSLPEVAGDAAVLVDPLDVDAMSAAMFQLLSDAALRRDLAIRGRERALQFGWDKTARNILDVLESSDKRGGSSGVE